MSQRFASKIAIVTGAGNGIGIPTATRLAEEGASVVLADKEEAAAQSVCRQITAAGGKAVACRVDICVPKDVEAMVAYAREQFGPAHIMINNAGIGSQKHFLAEHNIRVNTVAPGTVATARIKKSHNDERREAWLRSIPMARYGEPDEIAAAALFLASDDAAYITGQTIAVDGGFTAAGLRVKNLSARDGSY